MADRFVVLGIAGARSRWLGQVARWATTAELPVELVTALEAAEARAVLAAGRPVSAVLVDAAAGLDRDLVELARAGGAAVVAVVARDGRSDVDALGCDDRLADGFTAAELHEVLRRSARPASAPAAVPALTVRLGGERPVGALVVVTGTGGSGASTVAAALAQGLAGRGGDDVCLVDACRRGDLAMYHDQADPVPGLPELVELCRSDRPDPAQVLELVRPVPARGYGLVTGWRRPGDWSTTRRRTVAAVLDALARSTAAVVVDADHDVDDEATTASPDVEDRHAAILGATERADLLLVVARPGLHGLHGLARDLAELRRVGAPAERLVPVLNGSPGGAAGRALLTRTLHQVLSWDGEGPGVAPPLHLPWVGGVESAHREVGPLPRRLARAVTGGVEGLLTRLGPRPTEQDRPVRFNSGSAPRRRPVEEVA